MKSLTVKTNHLAPLNRRDFLKLAVLAGASTWLAGCRAGMAPQPTLPATAAPTATASLTPLPTATQLPSPSPSPSPSPQPTPLPPFTAAIGQAASYDPDTLRAALFAMFESLPGMAGLGQTRRTRGDQGQSHRRHLVGYPG